MKKLFITLKNNKKLKRIISILFQSLLIASITIICVCPLSCHISAEGIEIINGDYVSPKIESYKILDDKHLQLIFSEDVKLSCVSVTKCCDVPEELISKPAYGEKQKNIILNFSESTQIGQSYIVNGIVEDKYGNSLTFSIPFYGYNKNIPKIIITEIQSESEKLENNRYRSEYVKIMALEDGNLFGLILGSANNGPDLDYKFPALNIRKGEEIAIHLRNIGEGCVQEFGDNLELSTAPNSFIHGRDLWFENEESVLQNNADVIYIKDVINNRIVDGVMYRDKTKNEWPENRIKWARELENAGIVSSCLFENACIVNDVTPSVPLCRINKVEILNSIKNKTLIDYPIMNNKEDWKPIRRNNDITHE